jgi:hypothetical protein
VPPRGIRFDPCRRRYAITGGIEAKDQVRLTGTNGVMGGADNRPQTLTVRL